MSDEVEPPRGLLPRENVELGDMVALGARVNGKVIKYNWPLDEEGVSIEATPHYNLARDRNPVYTDIVIRFRFPGG